MKPQRYKLFLALSVVVVLGGLVGVVATKTTPRLGLDLEGGTGVILTAEGKVESDVLDKTVGIIRQRIDALGVAEPEVSRQGERNILIQLPGVANDEKARRLIGTTAQLTFRQVEKVIPSTSRKSPEVTRATGQEANDDVVVYPSGQPGEQGTLYRLKPAVLTGDIISQAEAVLDPQGGSWSVSLDMNGEGAARWAEFTKRLACLRDKGEQVQSQVAIVLDGKVESAAGMQDPATAGAGGGVTCAQGITGGQTSITVGAQGEAKNLALVLRTGALPITLEESEVTKVSPTLGRDSLDAGFTAGALGLGLVIVYVLIYYRVLGLVVLAGLSLFSAAIYSVMAILGAAAGLSLSLAGVAGLIVSVGITTDSYIVAFERLKDEVRSGKSIRAAVERGMARAFRTILVADFVTASAAVILFFLAVGPVRGFALTLGIATLVDVLIAYFFTRSAVGLLSRSKSFNESRLIGMRSALGVST